jgi:phosphate transport system permease protein
MNASRLIWYRKFQDRAFAVVGIVCTLAGILALVVMFSDLLADGLGALNLNFLTAFPSRHAAKAGILSAWVGTLCVMAVTVSTAVPLGVAAAVYLEEYAKRNWLTTLIEINISNLAGVPSIIYGLMALGLLVYQFHLGRSVLVGGLALAFLILPIVIVATREAIRAIPASIREAAYGVGATKWQVIWHHLLPYSIGGIATGTIIALSRAIGETAPLITIGALTYIAFLPPSPVQSTAPFVSTEWLNSPFTVLPMQMYNWVSRPTADFHRNAAATGLVLIAFTLSMNAVAIVIRYRARRRYHW